MTAPTPWLSPTTPQRAHINSTETTIETTVRDIIDTYFATVRDLILSTPSLGPQLSMWPTTQLWTDLITGQLIPVLTRIYTTTWENITSGDMRGIADSRSTYMALVENRLTGWPAEAWSTTRTLVDDAVQQGTSITDLSRLIEQQLRINGTPVWASDARRIARTETIGVLNGSSYAAAATIARETGTQRYKQWLATNDTRTRTTHRLAEGQTVSISDMFVVGQSELLYPGDPRADASEVIQCRCMFLILTEDEI